MRIATWNINSVRTRIQRALDLISKHDIDVLCLQETKAVSYTHLTLPTILLV